jgi:quercetin dioxygenase-like cupin family protein
VRIGGTSGLGAGAPEYRKPKLGVGSLDKSRRFSLMQKLIQVHQGQEYPGHRHDQHQAVAGFA